METNEIIILAVAGMIFLFFMIKPIFSAIKLKAIYIILGLAGTIIMGVIVRIYTDKQIVNLPNVPQKSEAVSPAYAYPRQEMTEIPKIEQPYEAPKKIKPVKEKPKPKIVEVKCKKTVRVVTQREVFTIGPGDSAFFRDIFHGGSSAEIFVDNKIKVRGECVVKYPKWAKKEFEIERCWPETNETDLLEGKAKLCRDMECVGLRNFWIINPYQDKNVEGVIHSLEEKEVSFIKKVEVTP